MSNSGNSLTAQMVDLVLAGLPKEQTEPKKMMDDEGSLPKLPAPSAKTSDDDLGQIRESPERMTGILISSDRPTASDDTKKPPSAPVSRGNEMVLRVGPSATLSGGTTRPSPNLGMRTVSGPFPALGGGVTWPPPSLGMRTVSGPSTTMGGGVTRPFPNQGTSALGIAPFGGAVKGSSGPGNLSAAGSGTRQHHITTAPRAPAVHHGQSSPAHRQMQTQLQPRAMSSNPSRKPPTELLSYECQKRGFNPTWYTKWANEGRVSVDCHLQGTIVKGNTAYLDPMWAKYATAELALKVVRGMPSRSQRQPEIKNEPLVKQEPGVKPEAERRRDGRADQTQLVNTRGRAGTASVQGPPGLSDSALVAAQVTRSLGIALPEFASSNPEVTRAFLEGVALGSRLGSTFDSASRGHRSSRSRSPVPRGRGPVEQHRTRSRRGSHRPDHSRRDGIKIEQADGQGINRPTTTIPRLNSEAWGHDGYYQQQSSFRRER